MGAMEVRDTANRLGVNGETALLLEHMLLSHHGLPEYGCAVRPMLLEAELLSMADNLDATVNQITTAVQAVEPGNFSEKLWALDQRKFYRHSGTDDTTPRILKEKEDTL
jgi:3'-5' exoribonuclease